MTHIDNTDLDGCEREPIHIPGSIQPHGLLLVADIRSLRVVAGAGALEERLTSTWLEQPLQTLLGQDVDAQIAALPQGAASLLLEHKVQGRDESFDAIVHWMDGNLVVELDPVSLQPTDAALLLTRLDDYARGFGQATTVAKLCERAASAFRALTGFDRVMIYQFGDEAAGHVLAEDRRPGLGSFLNHHFPGSDIPRQARALYVRNLARSIPDASYAPAPIRPAGYEGLDLSDVQLRSVSPVHLQYLRNMGVAASASFSIVRDGVLWGLVACHHGSSKLIPRGSMVAGTALANALARQIQAKERSSTYDRRLRLRLAIDELASEFSATRSVALTLRELAPRLCGLLHADGFAYVADGDVHLHGIGPAASDILHLVQWARENSPSLEPFASRRLSEHYAPAAAWTRLASGVLMLPLPNEEGAMLWFRVEERETVRWAGDPHKPMGDDAGRPLTPRRSFATWVETVHGRSHAWATEEIDAVSRLGRTYSEAQINRRIRRLNRELQDALTERDTLLEQKDLLMKEVDHRVQNSLQIVGSYLAIQAREAGPGPVADHLKRAGGRLSAVALVHRRLYQADQHETIELAHYLQELLESLLDALGDEWRPHVSFDFAPALIASRRAMSVGLVMTELILNASKYAYGGSPGPITVRVEQHAEQLRMTVRDAGGGREPKAPQGGGFGSRMIAATVAGLKGTLGYDDSPAGLSAVMAFPVAP